MMRRRARVDDCHGEIRDALRTVGFHVTDMARMGAGFPDLLAAWDGGAVLVEVKDGAKVASRRRLTSYQEAFHAAYPGPVVIVTSAEQAVETLLRLREAALLDLWQQEKQR